MKWAFVLFTLFCWTHGVYSVCCSRSYIQFRTTGFCADVDGANEEGTSNDVRYSSCEIYLCNDGKRSGGLYCGHGSCNIFGCNCDGGCRSSGNNNAKENFRRLYGSGVEITYYKS